MNAEEQAKVNEEAAKAIRRAAVLCSHAGRRYMMGIADLAEGVDLNITEENPEPMVLISIPYKVRGQFRGYVNTTLYVSPNGVINTGSELAR